PQASGLLPHRGGAARPTAATASLTERLNAAYDRFLAALPTNTSVTVDNEGWHLSPDAAEPVSADVEAGITGLRTWLRDKVSPIRLPELLIAVDNDLNWGQHFLPVSRRATRTADEVCQ